jgi:hypothetical protein
MPLSFIKATAIPIARRLEIYREQQYILYLKAEIYNFF